MTKPTYEEVMTIRDYRDKYYEASMSHAEQLIEGNQPNEYFINKSIENSNNDEVMKL